MRKIYWIWFLWTVGLLGQCAKESAGSGSLKTIDALPPQEGIALLNEIETSIDEVVGVLQGDQSSATIDLNGQAVLAVYGSGQAIVSGSFTINPSDDRLNSGALSIDFQDWTNLYGVVIKGKVDYAQIPSQTVSEDGKETIIIEAKSFKNTESTLLLTVADVEHRFSQIDYVHKKIYTIRDQEESIDEFLAGAIQWNDILYRFNEQL